MTEDPTSDGTPTPPVDPGDTAELDEAVEAAREDLAAELGVPSSQVDVDLAEAVVWPDSSLGCPQPGTSYAQGRVPGSRIVLKANGAAYSYHGVRGGVPVVCDQPQVPPPVR